MTGSKSASDFFSLYKKTKKIIFSGRGDFKCHHFPGGRFFFQPPLSAHLLPNLLAEKRTLLHRSHRTLIEKCTLSISPGEHLPLCLKENIPRHGAKASKAFVLGHLCAKLSLPTPRVLGLVERKRWGLFPGPSLLITQFVENAYELHWQIRQTFGPSDDPRRKKIFVHSLARFWAGFYQQGVFHYDLSSQNILVRPRGDDWEFFLIDLEDVRFPKVLEPSHLVKNFIHLGDLPRWISQRDKIRFFHRLFPLLPFYLQDQIKNRKRDFLGKIQQGMEERIGRRIARDGGDWVRELDWLPHKGKVGKDVPYPTVPPREE